MNATDLFVSIVFAAVVYFVPPLLYILLGKNLSPKKVSRFIIIYEIIAYIILCIIHYLCGDSKGANFTATLTWGAIAYGIAMKKYPNNTDSQNSPNTSASKHDNDLEYISFKQKKAKPYALITVSVLLALSLVGNGYFIYSVNANNDTISKLYSEITALEQTISEQNTTIDESNKQNRILELRVKLRDETIDNLNGQISNDFFDERSYDYGYSSGYNDGYDSGYDDCYYIFNY